MKKYILASVFLGFVSLVSSVDAVESNTGTRQRVNVGASAPMLKVSAETTVVTSAQIKEKISATKNQIVSLQEQMVRLENMLKEALAREEKIRASGGVKTDSGSIDGTVNVKLKEPIMQTVNEMVIFGQRGENVKKLQEFLIQKGYLKANADGSFGPKTLEAVSTYQKAMNLKVSGAVDADTLLKIKATPVTNTSVNSVQNAY